MSRVPATTQSAILRFFLAGILLLTTLAIEPEAQAASIPLPPKGFVVDVLGYANYTNHVWVSRVNVTVYRNVDDPLDGSYQYALCGTRDVGVGANNCTTLTLYDIPGRSPWANTNYHLELCSGINRECSDDPSPLTTYFVNVTNTSSSGFNAAGCTLDVKHDVLSPFLNLPSQTSGEETVAMFNPLSELGSGQCGDDDAFPNATAGLSAYATTFYGPSLATPAYTNVSWRLAANDTNQTWGALDYYLFKTYISSVDVVPGYVCGTDRDGRDACTPYRGVQDVGNDTGADPTGIRQGNVSGFGAVGERNALYFQVVARDNLTHARSPFSCRIMLLEGLRGSSAYCGNLLPGNATMSIAPAPSFPMLDVPSWSSSMGLSTNAGSWLLGGVLLFAIGIAGYKVASVVGAAVGAILAWLVVTAFGLFPLWLLVVPFAVFVTVIALYFTKGSGGEA